jgi:hypothetical protein
MNKKEVFKLLKSKFDFLDNIIDKKKYFIIRGRLINSLDLDTELEFFGTDKEVQVTIYDDYLSNNFLGSILNENITEQKLDEILSQINKINNSFYMIKQIVKGMELNKMNKLMNEE